MLTTTLAVLVIESLAVITVIRASPLLTAVTTPSWLTVAILSSLDFQLIVSETIEGYKSALSVFLYPTTICREDGVIETLSIGMWNFAVNVTESVIETSRGFVSTSNSTHLSNFQPSDGLAVSWTNVPTS